MVAMSRRSILLAMGLAVLAVAAVSAQQGELQALSALHIYSCVCECGQQRSRHVKPSLENVLL